MKAGNEISFEQLVAALREAGLTKGDIVHVQSSLVPFGRVQGITSRDNTLEFYYQGFMEVLGDTGTLLVHTPFENYGRYGTPFVVEESPSTAGVFSEFVRTRPGAIRSLHPIVSVTGIGPAAEEICGHNHFEGFSWESPWGKMHRMNVKLMGFGLGYKRTFSFSHYIEAAYGVPYQYVKLFNTPVYKNGKRIHMTFTMTVRYLDYSIAYDFSYLEKRLLADAGVQQSSLAHGVIQCVNAEPAFQVGIDCLNKNRYAFLKQAPQFRPGEIPFDGYTGEMKECYDAPGPNLRKHDDGK